MFLISRRVVMPDSIRHLGVGIYALQLEDMTNKQYWVYILMNQLHTVFYVGVTGNSQKKNLRASK